MRISGESISGKDNSSKEKQYATYLFCEYILKNYKNEFNVEFIKLLVKRYRENIWRNGFPLNINLPKLFLLKGSFLHAIYFIKVSNDLKKRITLRNRIQKK